MTKYLISFPSEAMVVSDEEFPIVVATPMPSSKKQSRLGSTYLAEGSMSRSPLC